MEYVGPISWLTDRINLPYSSGVIRKLYNVQHLKMEGYYCSKDVRKFIHINTEKSHKVLESTSIPKQLEENNFRKKFKQ